MYSAQDMVKIKGSKIGSNDRWILKEMRGLEVESDTKKD